MPQTSWSLQWLDHNGIRKYPLADTASCIDTTGSFTLPDDFLLELDLPVHAAIGGDPASFFLRTIGVYSTGYVLVVAYDNGVEVVDAASVMIPKASHTRYKTYALGGIDPFDDSVGKVVIGRLESIDAQPAGLFEFELEATRLDPDAIRPLLRGVQSISVVNGSQRSARFVGDIELIAGRNVRLTPSVGLDGINYLRIDAISGEGLNEECECVDDIPCIKTIGGVAPSPEGDFQLIGDDCLQVETIENGVRIRDLCCEPCCGCEELEAVTRDLDRFRTERENLEQFMRQFTESVHTMDLIVLGSRLSDQGCISCDE